MAVVADNDPLDPGVLPRLGVDDLVPEHVRLLRTNVILLHEVRDHLP